MEEGGNRGDPTRPTPNENWLLGKVVLSWEGPGGPGIPSCRVVGPAADPEPQVSSLQWAPLPAGSDLAAA